MYMSIYIYIHVAGLVYIRTCTCTCSWSCLTAVSAATKTEQAAAATGGATRGDIELQEIEPSGALVEEQKPATNYGMYVLKTLAQSGMSL